MKQWRGWTAALAPIAVIALLMWLMNPAAAGAQGGITNFDSVVLSGDLIVGDDVTIGDGAAVNDLTVADFVNVTAQTEIVLTMNGTLTPTGSLQPVSAAGAVSVNGGTSIVHTTDYLILVNVGAQTITFTETTGLISAGNIALGAGDSATLVWADGGWMQVAASNN